MDLNIIIPVAPADLLFAHKCVRTVIEEIHYLYDSVMVQNAIENINIRVVVDGMTEEVEKGLAEGMITDNTKSPFYCTGPGLPSVILHLDVLQESAGPGIARNYALAQCSPNSIVTFMDADDTYLTSGLQTLVVQYLFRTWEMAEEGIDLPLVVAGTALSQLSSETPESRFLRICRLLPDGSDSLRAALQRVNALFTTAVAAPAFLLQDVGGFEPNLVCGEDGNLWRRISEKDVEIVLIDVPISQYTHRPDSQSKTSRQWNDQAFFLEPDVMGQMGQSLDNEAKMRGMLFSSAGTLAAKIQALCQFKSEEVLHHREVFVAPVAGQHEPVAQD